ncbi:hypothetical protein CPLU01_02128 [Colletotrichum plurivorum]|uniref:Uncharacterized protein n=1 Tax=Colletotrichum plurivorum TaxID=2175906 RepID=A0A8H6KWU2_9PEZI|nr:hypothetical protein CPLU01_02128 [Colletotrichum plurivorum]
MAADRAPSSFWAPQDVPTESSSGRGPRASRPFCRSPQDSRAQGFASLLWMKRPPNHQRHPTPYDRTVHTTDATLYTPLWTDATRYNAVRRACGTQFYPPLTRETPGSHFGG